MTHAERYVELGLRLGRHVEGLVDAYFGPPELKERVDAEEPVDPALLAADAEALLAGLADGWLADQVRGCVAYAFVLAGEPISYSDEVERCYGVRPEKTPEDVYRAAHEELDGLLPGDGTLHERREAWRESHRVTGEAAIEALRGIVPIMRAQTAALIALPEGERLTLEPVEDEPWWAFNYYQGGLESRIVLNTDAPTTGHDLLHLAAHEVYPGHHTEHALKEQLLVRGRGLVEESIFLVPTPQSLLSEGIAETGPDLLVDDDVLDRAAVVLEQHGIRADLQLSHRIAAAAEPLRTVSVDAALMIHEDGASLEEAQAYVQRFGLTTEEQAARSIRFVTDPTWRAYTITYSAGRDLCRAYVDGRAERFRRLLTEQVRIGELQAAAR